MMSRYRIRRLVVAGMALMGLVFIIFQAPDLWTQQVEQSSNAHVTDAATDALRMIAVKGRPPKTGYARTQFGDGWAAAGGCDTRNNILRRDLVNVALNEKCQVVTGSLHDPYTGKDIEFRRGSGGDAIQIDHVVALGNAWQTGAQQLSSILRKKLANDLLELLGVDGSANQEKSDGDAATWLPHNKSFRCQYVARQIAVKKKYNLWVTSAEKDAMNRVLLLCPGQLLPN